MLTTSKTVIVRVFRVEMIRNGPMNIVVHFPHINNLHSNVKITGRNNELVATNSEFLAMNES